MLFPTCPGRDSPICHLALSQRSRLTPWGFPSLYSPGLCYPAGMLPGKEKTWRLCGPAMFHSSCCSTLPEAFTFPQPASAKQLFLCQLSRHGNPRINHMQAWPARSALWTCLSLGFPMLQTSSPGTLDSRPKSFEHK